MRSTIFLLALPLLSSARPQNPDPAPAPAPAPANVPTTITVATTVITSSILATTFSSTTSSTNPSSPPSSSPSSAPSNNSTSRRQTTTSTPDPNALTPSQRAANFALDYQRLLAAQRNNTLFQALQTAPSPGNTPRASASAAQNSYIAALRTATGSIPQPAYITGLPADQRAYMESLNEQIAEIASVDFRGVATTSTSATTGNGTSSTDGNGGGQVVTPGPEATAVVVSPSQPPPANTTISSTGMGVGSQPTGVYKMAAGAAMGVLGVAALL